jgi:hypothetical protein
MRYKENGMRFQRKDRWLLLLRPFGRELPDISGCQEVHHRFVALLHREQLRDLHVSAPARSPSRCFPHLFPVRFRLVFPSAAVAEEVFPRLGRRPTSAEVVLFYTILHTQALHRHCST